MARPVPPPPPVRETNIVLIGMPGAGKSMAGVLLAKALRKRFVDTDLLIQEATGRHLQEIIDAGGPAAFLQVEEETICSRTFRNAVIATGGSVVYSRRAMEHLKRNGIIVYLAISFDEMEARLRNITTRGVVLMDGESLDEMYRRRLPLYRKYAGITVDADGRDFESIVEEIAGEASRRPHPPS